MVWTGYKTLLFPWIFSYFYQILFRNLSGLFLFAGGDRCWGWIRYNTPVYDAWVFNIIMVDGIFSLKKSKSCLFFKTGSWSHLSLVHFLSLSTGILSFFAVQAGAKKVYAIEASSMASHAEVCTVSGYQTCCCFKFIC